MVLDLSGEKLDEARREEYQSLCSARRSLDLATDSE
jgi:hypothetical protein